MSPLRYPASGSRCRCARNRVRCWNADGPPARDPPEDAGARSPGADRGDRPRRGDARRSQRARNRPARSEPGASSARHPHPACRRRSHTCCRHLAGLRGGTLEAPALREREEMWPRGRTAPQPIHPFHPLDPFHPFHPRDGHHLHDTWHRRIDPDPLPTSFQHGRGLYHRQCRDDLGLGRRPTGRPTGTIDPADPPTAQPIDRPSGRPPLHPWPIQTGHGSAGSLSLW